LIKNFIEERNYLLFTIANRVPSELKELMSWSLEGLYQFIYANNVDAKKIEARRKTDDNRKKIK
jgi:hypothetical protein